jgi:plastocyanin
MRTSVSTVTIGGAPLIVALLMGCSSSTPRTLPAPNASDDAGEGQTEATTVESSQLDNDDNELPGLVASGVDDAGVGGATIDSSRAEAGPVCQPAFAGCSSFTDATAADADRTIHFQDYSYDPQCLMVRSGQTVTFAGDFIRHPLTPSCGPELLLEHRDTSPTASFVMEAVGIYGYYCLDHGNPQGQAMSGTIEVVP